MNREQFYVSASRAKKDVHVYTNGIKALRLVVGRERKKEIALAVVKQLRSVVQQQPCIQVRMAQLQDLG